MSYLVFDVETGGKKYLENAVVQFAGILVDDSLQEVGRLQRIIKPYSDFLTYTKEAEGVHGISTERIMDEGVELSEFMLDLCELMAKTSKAIPVAHNAVFDEAFLRQIFLFSAIGDDLFKGNFADLDKRLKKANFKIENYFKTSDGIVEKHLNYIDTLALSRFLLKGTVPGFGLGVLCNHFGYKLEGAHDAMVDTEGLLHVFKNLKAAQGQETYVRDYKFQF